MSRCRQIEKASERTTIETHRGRLVELDTKITRLSVDERMITQGEEEVETKSERTLAMFEALDGTIGQPV